MNENKIIIIVDCRTQVGAGHITRCIALNQILLDAGYNSELYQDLSPGSINTTLISLLNCSNLVILDGYDYDRNYERQIKSKCSKLIRIIDYPIEDTQCDGLISHSLYDNNSISQNIIKLFGLECALLRKQFNNAIRVRINKCAVSLKDVKKLFICFGAIDTHGHSEKILCLIGQALTPNQINIVTSESNCRDILKSHFQEFKDIGIDLNVYFSIPEEEIFSLINDADLIISSASNIAIEACCVGAALIVAVSADNQQYLYDQLVGRQLALGVGRVSTVSNVSIDKAINELFAVPGRLDHILRQQEKIFDGQANRKIVDMITRVLNA